MTRTILSFQPHFQPINVPHPREKMRKKRKKKEKTIPQHGKKAINKSSEKATK